LIVGVPKETYPKEQRIALVPAVVAPLHSSGLEIWLEAGAGEAAGFPDSAYADKGVRVLPQRAQLFHGAEVILQVRGFGANLEAGRADLELYRADQVLIGFLDPLAEPAAMQQLAERRVSAFAMELIPRVTRAQSMDALSSMATVAGYKAVLIAAEALPKMFPLLMTAAGTINPARVLIVGAGVAGLQAISTARKLGALVYAYDIRPAVKEQVQSLGAKFVELPLETKGTEGAGGYAQAMGEEFYRLQQELMAKAVASSDVVITTAAVPGKKAPVLITAEMIQFMNPGSVIVDLAADRGGNCELTRPGEIVVQHGVTIIGPLNVASTVPFHASQMYAKNISTFLLHLVKEGQVQLDVQDEITRETLVTHRGEVVHPRVREALGLAPIPATGRSKSG
jgi:NAD(P) transhydrogenase subunit alpha